MAIHLTGSWKLVVAGKEAAFDQRIIISGSSNDKDGTFGWDEFGTKTVKGSFGIQVQYMKAENWHNSLMRIGNADRQDNKVTLKIETDDNVGSGDLDFNDLVLTAESTVGEHDYCVWGQVRSYSGCIFNPCKLPRLVIDDWIYAVDRIDPRLRDLLEPTLRELPPFKRPPLPDPPPWEHRAIKVEVPPSAISQLTAPLSPRRGSFRERGLMMLDSPMDEVVQAAEVSTVAMHPGISGLLRRRCRVDPAPGVILRIIDYDPGPGESPSGPFVGTGDREVLGQVATDDWGFYFFCFPWSYPHFGGLKPDIMLQVIRYDEEGVPYVALESEVSWNIDKLYRKNLCIPAHLIDPITPDPVAPSRTGQYVGNQPVVRISTAPTAALGRGHATSVPGDGTATYPLHLENAPFGGVLLLKASFHDLPQVEWYQIRYRTTDNPDGNTGWSDLNTPLRYYDSSWVLQTVGPEFTTIEGNLEKAYPNLEGDFSYSHPHGHQYKGYINTGFVKTGFLHLQIHGYDSGGSFVPGSFDWLVLRIDNIAPLVEVEPITVGGGACGLVAITSPSQRIPVTYRVIDAEGHLRRYFFKLWKCHNNLVGNQNQYQMDYEPSAHGMHWYGTPDLVSPTPDMNGWVTRDLPEVGDFFTAAEAATRPNFVAIAVELWASSRTTNGIVSSIHHPRYVEVIGIKLE